MQVTSRELSEVLGISYPVAAGLLTLLEDAGLIRVVGKKAHFTNRGKRTKVFDLSTPITIDFAKIAAENTPVPVIQAAHVGGKILSPAFATRPAPALVEDQVEEVEDQVEEVEDQVEEVEEVEDQVEEVEDQVEEVEDQVEDEDQVDEVDLAKARLREAV